MNTRIAVVLLGCLLAAAPAIAAEDNGRYVVRDVTVIPGTESDKWPMSALVPRRGTILLDTTTGKTWLLRILPGGGVQWQAVKLPGATTGTNMKKKYGLE